MQLNPPSYLHYGHHFCSGYNKYLTRRQHGNTISYNWQAFFFNMLWLCYHRMYKEMALFMFIIMVFLVCFSTHVLNVYSFMIGITGLYVTFSMYAHRLYEKHCELKFWRYRHQENIYKYIKPHNIFLVFIIFVVYAIFLFVMYAHLFKVFFQIV